MRRAARRKQTAGAERVRLPVAAPGAATVAAVTGHWPMRSAARFCQQCDEAPVLLSPLSMPTAEYRRIDAEQALTFIFSACEHDRPYTLFDARDAHAFGHGHIPTAQPLAEREIGNWLGKLPRAQPVLIYCYHGFSSQTFAKTFADFGFREVYSVDGGLPALVEAFKRAREAAQAASAPQPTE